MLKKIWNYFTGKQKAKDTGFYSQTITAEAKEHSEELVKANRKLRRGVKAVTGTTLPHYITREERSICQSLLRK